MALRREAIDLLHERSISMRKAVADVFEKLLAGELVAVSKNAPVN